MEPVPNVDTQADLVRALTGLGYDMAAFSTTLFRGTPQPAAAYRVIGSDGLTLTLLTYRPDDYDRYGYVTFDNRPATAGTRNQTGFEDRQLPRRGSLLRPRIFRKGEVVVYFYNALSAPAVQSELYRDLESLLGPAQRSGRSRR